VMHFKETVNASLDELLPHSFSPDALLHGSGKPLLEPQDNAISLSNNENGNELVKIAFEEAKLSYAPYTKSPSGCAIQTKNKKIYSGSYIENAAHNPSLSCIHCAIISLVAGGEQWADVESVVVVEKRDSKVKHSFYSAWISSVFPTAKFYVHLV